MNLLVMTVNMQEHIAATGNNALIILQGQYLLNMLSRKLQDTQMKGKIKHIFKNIYLSSSE